MLLEMLVAISDIAYFFLALAVLIFAFWMFFIYRAERKQKKDKTQTSETNKQKSEITFMAYERLILLAERIALPNLISRLNNSALSAREMQMLLNENIKQEFEHNISQQIYVSSEAWNAIRNLKEQNQLAINQIANMMPANANGLDLNKQILEFVMNHPKGNLHTLVQEVISFEAKGNL